MDIETVSVNSNLKLDKIFMRHLSLLTLLCVFNCIFSPEMLNAVDLPYAESIVLNKKQSFASQVVHPDKVYEVRDDFDLKGQTIVLPESSQIIFNGGSIKGGVLVGNRSLITFLSGGIYLELKGSFRNDTFDITWFGAKPSYGGEIIDNTEALNVALLSSGSTSVPLKVPTGTFYHDGLILPANASITGSSINNSVLRLMPSSHNSNLTIVNNGCQVSNLTIYGNDKNQRFEITYDEHDGNGITICNGSRLGYNTFECTNTKLFNLIINRCGNCGLAILDKHKWVYNFYNITISRCGNIGFLDKSSDNNYLGFNISHCENAGMVVKGGRNRYTTFKVFVCGYNYRNAENGKRPQSVYWQGVRVEGIHNILSSFDIQECGAELLYVGTNARGNNITATLDRPGFGSKYIGDYRSYDIQGYGNILDLVSLKSESYHELPGRALNSNMLILAQDNSNGCSISPVTYPYPVKSNHVEPLFCSFASTTGTRIKESNQDKYISFSDHKAVLNKSLDLMMTLNNTNELAVSVSFRLYLQKGESRTFYYVFDSPYSAVSIKILRGDSGFYSELRNNSVEVSKSVQASGNDYVDVYINKNGCDVSCILKDKTGVVINRINSPDEPFVRSSVLQSFRLSSGAVLSDLHVVRGQVSDPIDIKTTYGLYLPMAVDLSAELDDVQSDISRPMVNVKGFMFFDENLGKPIWWDGENWIDAYGNRV